MSEVNVPLEFMQKTAQFIKGAGEKLQAVEDAKAKWASEAPGIVDNMISVGSLPASQKEAAVKELVDGGLEKAAQVIGHLTSQLRLPVLGQADQTKQAATAETASADQVFRDTMLG
jgi:hypothetical protein